MHKAVRKTTALFAVFGLIFIISASFATFPSLFATDQYEIRKGGTHIMCIKHGLNGAECRTDDWTDERSGALADPRVTMQFAASAALAEDLVPGLRRRLPQAIMIGMDKCGTDALKLFLTANLSMAVVEPFDSEIQFFHQPNKYELGYSYYRSLMPESLPGQVTMEGSPQYLPDKGVPKRMWQMNPDLKLIVIFIHPADRVISLATHIWLQKANHTNTTIEKYLGDNWKKHEIVQSSIYYRGVVNFVHYFPLNQIHVMDGQRMRTAPWEEMTSLERFLGVPVVSNQTTFEKGHRGFYCRKAPKERKCLGSNKGRIHLPVSDSFYQTLKKFYIPHNQYLVELIGRRFDWF